MYYENKVWKERRIVPLRTVDEYMALSYRMEITSDPYEGGFVVSYPELPGCITCGSTINRALTNALDAKRAWFEAAVADQIKIPDPKNKMP